jgi:hypothetical protein
MLSDCLERIWHPPQVDKSCSIGLYFFDKQFILIVNEFDRVAEQMLYAKSGIN